MFLDIPLQPALSLLLWARWEPASPYRVPCLPPALSFQMSSDSLLGLSRSHDANEADLPHKRAKRAQAWVRCDQEIQGGSIRITGRDF